MLFRSPVLTRKTSLHTTGDLTTTTLTSAPHIKPSSSQVPSSSPSSSLPPLPSSTSTSSLPPSLLTHAGPQHSPAPIKPSENTAQNHRNGPESVKVFIPPANLLAFLNQTDTDENQKSAQSSTSSCSSGEVKTSSENALEKDDSNLPIFIGFGSMVIENPKNLLQLLLQGISKNKSSRCCNMFVVLTLSLYDSLYYV